MFTERASLHFLFSSNSFPQSLVGASPSHCIALVPLWSFQGTPHLLLLYLALFSKLDAKILRLSYFCCRCWFLVLPSLILPLVTVGISSCFILYAVLPHHLLLHSFLIIVSNNLLPLLPFSSELFSDLEEQLPHPSLTDTLFCIHLSQPLIIDHLKSWS